MNFVGIIVFLLFYLYSQSSSNMMVDKGAPGGRIIGGTPAKRGQIKYQAAIFIRKFGEKYFCGGSLISKRWVLTAAHCIANASEWWVKLGTIYKVREVTEKYEQLMRTNISHIPCKYEDLLGQCDMGLLKLPEEAKLSHIIQPIRLPKLSLVKKPLKKLKIIVSGFGQLTTSRESRLSPVLMYTKLVTLTNEECGEIYGAITPQILCAIGKHNNGVCFGDSGGPGVFKEKDGIFTILATATFLHKNGCLVQYPSGWSRVAHFLWFIKKHTDIPIRK